MSKWIVSRTLLVPESEDEAIDLMEASIAALQKWEAGDQRVTAAEHLEKTMFPECYVEVIDSAAVGGDGKPRLRREYDYVTECDYVTVHYPFAR